ncbi:PilW family protein [Legionella yabuuchiae]|uniref:PilW family protein n=1 Tax=Legionella yabuuchiae TaxID=376727 RepID=UPI001054CC26|nr:PilW family protein [Legionella yabuuchiae]
MSLLHKGFSIVEFMISITLGGVLLATAGAVYLTNKTTFKVQDSLARLQENARYAIHFLNKEIRMAGYQGCPNSHLVDMTNIVTNPSPALVFDTPVYGYDGLSASFSPALPSNLSGKAIANSDVIEVRRASRTNVQLRADMVRKNNPILVYDRLGIVAGEVIMISSCNTGDIFIAGSNTNATAITHTTSNNTTNDLSAAYKAGAHIMRFVYFAFYVKDTGRTNSNNEPIYALVRQDLDGNEIELVEGIERMKVIYGVDTNDDYAADTFQTATEVNTSNNWDKVISLRINLLFATTENVSNQTQAYQFNDTTYSSTDRKLRREWQTLITLRNRGLPS